MPEYRRAPYIEVAQGDWKTLEDEGVLATKGIATCIGVSFYDKANKKAMLGHFDAQDLSDGVVESMMDEANHTFLTPEETRIWVGGGALLDPGTIMRSNPDIDLELVAFTNEETLHFRNAVLTSVEDAVEQGATLSRFWLRGMATYDYSLNVGTGSERRTYIPSRDN